MGGCSASKQVTRVDADTTIDLSGRWNDTDSRMVADDIIQDCLFDHGISVFVLEHGTYPCRYVYNRY